MHIEVSLSFQSSLSASQCNSRQLSDVVVFVKYHDTELTDDHTPCMGSLTNISTNTMVGEIAGAVHTYVHCSPTPSGRSEREEGRKGEH